MIRLTLALVLAAAAALAVDSLGRRRGLDPPGFRDPLRRTLASVLLAVVFLLGVFLPAVHFDQVPEVDPETLEPATVFVLQILLLVALALWLALGYLGVDGGDADGGDAGGETTTGEARGRLADALGLRCRNPLGELAFGAAAGLVAWGAVLMTVTAVALFVEGVAGDGVLGGPPAEMIVWMAGLPAALRLSISISAGAVEELFFRGFLQTRIGIPLSTLLFVIGHLGYGQPFMLVGLTLLSLFYALLFRMRGSIWAAVAAHAIFDAVQLLVVIPAALKAIDAGDDSALLCVFGIC